MHATLIVIFPVSLSGGPQDHAWRGGVRRSKETLPIDSRGRRDAGTWVTRRGLWRGLHLRVIDGW